jgi:hypothetical protein
MRILTALLALVLVIGADAANAQRVTGWWLTEPGSNPNLRGAIRELPDTIFAKRAECQAKAKHYEKMHGERQICMKIKVDKNTITDP